MAVLHVILVTLAVCGLDAVQGEIPNEIKEFVLSLLQKHDGEVMELKKEIRTLRQEISLLQRSYLKVVHELDDIRQKENTEVSVPIETEMDDKIQNIDITSPSSQNVTQSSAPMNSAGDKQLSKIERARKGKVAIICINLTIRESFST